ncbi:MAG TPA: hypothetical protein VHE55_01850 [Fimbriimonadaceae bacterium]|nr:hypothetical protein [Fimbriimonadaceae bacterium]
MLSALVALALGSHVLPLQGGSDVELVHQLAIGLERPVALLAQPQRVWKKQQIEWRDDEGPAKPLRVKLGLDLTRTAAIGTSAGGYPESFYFLLKRSGYAKGFKTAKLKVDEDGPRFSVRTADGPVVLGTACAPLKQARLSWHWFFENAYLAIDAQNVTESEYVRLIADCLGAKVEKKDGGYYLDFDPAAYRRRGISTLKRLAAASPQRGGDAGDDLYSAAVLAWLTDAQIANLFDRPDDNHTVTYDASNAPDVLAAAHQRLLDRFPVEDDHVQRSKSVVELWDGMKNVIDWSVPPKVVASNQGLFLSMYSGRRDGHYFTWVW